MAKNLQATITFEYSGVLKGTDTSPIDGVRTAAIADPISVLLYPGRWFPMTGYLTDRFTAEMHITVPEGETVVGSGSSRLAEAATRRSLAVQLQLDQARLSRHHRRRQVRRAHLAHRHQPSTSS